MQDQTRSGIEKSAILHVALLGGVMARLVLDQPARTF
jgi:hypothetical protein